MGKLSGLLELLKAPLKIISHNGKLMAITATVYLILYTISLILYNLSANPFVIDLTLKLFDLASARAGTPEFTELLVAICEDSGIYLGIVAAYVVLFFFVALFSQTAVIIISSSYYTSYDLSLKELVIKVSKTWTRPLVTSLLVQLIALGYTGFFFLPFMLPSLILYNHRGILIAFLIAMAIIFITLYIYLSVVWSLGVVVSVVEDSCGLLALGKAKELLKGKRTHGFLLNIGFLLISVVILVIGSKIAPVMPLVVLVIQTLFIGVISMFQSMAYSGYYFQCKNGMMKSGGLEYSQIPTAQVLNEDLA